MAYPTHILAFTFGTLSALDLLWTTLKTMEPLGRPWDFMKTHKRIRNEHLLQCSSKPNFLIGVRITLWACLNTVCWAPPPESDSLSRQLGPRMCLSNKFPGDANAPGPHFLSQTLCLALHLNTLQQGDILASVSQTRKPSLRGIKWPRSHSSGRAYDKPRTI